MYDNRLLFERNEIAETICKLGKNVAIYRNLSNSSEFDVSKILSAGVSMLIFLEIQKKIV